MASIIKWALIFGLATVAILAAEARATDIELSVDKLSIRDSLPDNPLKRKLSWRVRDPAIVIGAPGSSDDPRCIADGGSGGGGTIRFFSDGSAGSLQDTGDISLPCQQWRKMGTAARPSGYRYLDPRQEWGPCRLVRVKGGSHPQVRAHCKGKNPSQPLAYDLTLGTDEGIIGAVLTLGTTRYCTASDDFRGRDGSNGRLFEARNSPRPASCPEPCDCCNAGLTTLTFEPAAASGACGHLRNFRCSNSSASACSTNSDCNFGTCVTQFSGCENDFSVSCSSNADCEGTCEEKVEIGLPQDLLCGYTYTGGSHPTVDTSIRLPEGPSSKLRVTDCDIHTKELTLGPMTASDTNSNLTCTEGRKCSNDDTPCARDADCGAGTCEDRCFFGAVTPVVNTIKALSSCEITVVTEDVTGSAQCNDGQVNLDIKALARVYSLTGDLLSSSKPPDVPGTQPCPLCVKVCEGGANNGFPCSDDTDCSGGSCSSSRQCLGGENDGGSCTPDTADNPMGDPSLDAAFPTSHDCLPPTEKLQSPPLMVHFPLVSVPTTNEAVDMSADARRVFCGFCSDIQTTGSFCFDGNPDPNASCPFPRQDSAVPCNSDADCTAPYESCAQRWPGAFGSSETTRVDLLGGSDGQCLGDRQKHDATLEGFSCSAPTFNEQMDKRVSLPGPSAVTIPAKISLSP